MVDALVLEASTSVCGFESHLPHQKEKGAERCLFLLVPAAAGTSASLYVWQEPAVPPHTPLPFCDTIQFAIETDRSCHRQRPGAEWHSGLFSLPQICAPVPADLNLPGSKKAPGRVPSFGLYHRLPQDSPSRTRAAERHSATIHSSLFSIHSPSPALFPSGTDSKTKIYFVFFHLTHNSTRYNIGLNLIMEGKEYGKTGSA